MSRLRTAAATDTGYLRATNQDLALATSDLAAVADGMGGPSRRRGRRPDRGRELLRGLPTDRTTEGLLAAVREANERGLPAAAGPTATFAGWARP